MVEPHRYEATPEAMVDDSPENEQADLEETEDFIRNTLGNRLARF